MSDAPAHPTTASAPAAPTGPAVLPALPARLRASDAGPTVSFELYPPRSEAATASLWRTIPRLAEVTPDFFSVTYGASGSSRETSRAVVQWILEHTATTTVAHLTCLGSPHAQVRAVAEQLVADGVRDFLALRGDPPAGVPDWRPDPAGLQRASELVELLRDVERAAGEPLSIAVAASPAALVAATADGGGPASCGDLQALVAKQAAGADHAITQVFFRPEDYVRYVEVARASGVDIPLLPGIVPLADPQRLRRLQEISGVEVPATILARLDAEQDDERRRAAGVAMGVELVEAVLDAGAPGLHLYAFNQSRDVVDLLEGAGLADPAARAARARGVPVA